MRRAYGIRYRGVGVVKDERLSKLVAYPLIGAVAILLWTLIIGIGVELYIWL